MSIYQTSAALAISRHLKPSGDDFAARQTRACPAINGPVRFQVTASISIGQSFNVSWHRQNEAVCGERRVPVARVPFEIGYKRALRLLCPLCGHGKLFSGLTRMNERCSHCDFKFEREPGYFLGSTYINYGWTSASLTIAYILFHVVLQYPNSYVVPPLVAWFVLFPMFFHRYARAMWLTFDCFWDHTELPDGTSKSDQSPTGNSSTD
jgi:uncharacterized protein (DUF983 family)